MWLWKSLDMEEIRCEQHLTTARIFVHSDGVHGNDRYENGVQNTIMIYALYSPITIRSVERTAASHCGVHTVNTAESSCGPYSSL